MGNKSGTQRDLHTGEHRRGTIPQNVHFQDSDERVNELITKASSLPADSTARHNIERVLRTDYGVNL
jgi:hypothetical protein